MADACMLLGCVLAAGAGSLLLGQDANWDLQNYHHYNPWAWWHGRTFGPDLGAAQLQTYHNPLPHLPFFAMVSAAWPPRLIAFVLALPAGLAAFVLAKLSWLLLADMARTQRLALTIVAVLVGMTSAMGIGALGNTMNEWLLAAMLLAALWLLARALAGSSLDALSRPVLVLAGLIAGVAAGLKLIAATFAVALVIAVVVRGPQAWRALPRRAAEAAWCALGVGAGVLLAYGWWAHALWTHFDNPVFPYFNQWFRSPWWLPAAVPMPHDYGPHDALAWLAFPFRLAAPPVFMVAEVAYRDGRIAVVAALAIVAVVLSVPRGAAAHAQRQEAPIDAPVARAWRLVIAFAIVAFVLWAVQYAIYRYLLVVDALTGLLLVGLLRRLLPQRFTVVAACLLAGALLATTRPADWGHVPFGARWFELRVPTPTLEPDALVLITTGEAVSYLVPLLPADARYVAALNTLVSPERPTRLTEEVERIVRDYHGAIYQLTFPLTEGQEVLARHGLVRTPYCAVLVTNMPTSPLELCRLLRREIP